MASYSDIEPVTALKREAAELIARAKERQSPIVITQNGKPTAVLQDVKSYERQRRTMQLLELLVQGESDYEAGRTLSSKKLDKRIQARLTSLKKTSEEG